MKEKRKFGRKLLSFLLTLALVLGLMPGMSMTAYAASAALTDSSTNWTGNLEAYNAVTINNNVTTNIGNTYLYCTHDVTVNGSLTVNGRLLVYGPGKLYVNGNVVINSGKAIRVTANDGTQDGVLVAKVSSGDCITGSGTLEVEGHVTASAGEDGVGIKGVSLRCNGTLYGNDAAAINEENKKDSPYQKLGLRNSVDYESHRYMYVDDGFVDAQTLSEGDTFSVDLRGIKNCTSLTLQAGGYATEEDMSSEPTPGTDAKNVEVTDNRVSFDNGKIYDWDSCGYISPYANGKTVNFWQVVSNNQGALVLTGWISHTHSFTYSLNDAGDTITAMCSADGCPLTDSKATLTIAAPTTGNDATITVSPEGALTGYTVKYQTKSGGTWSNEMDAAPTTAGFHKAIVSLGGVSASVIYGNNCITYANNLVNGSISGANGAAVGATVEPTITPDTGYELDTLTVTPETGSVVGEVTVNGGTFVMPEANVTVSATFKKINSAITVTQPTGGTVTAKINDADVTAADYDDTITLGNTPADGYNFGSYSVTKTGESSTVVSVSNDTFTMPEYPVTVTGTFTHIDYNVTVSATTNGTVQASKTSNAHIGDEITLTVTPSTGYQLDTLTVTKVNNDTVSVSGNKFTMPASNVTVAATFKEITYTVTANGATATVKDSLPTSNTYTAELTGLPSDKTYDGESVTLTATVQKSAGFPADKVTVGGVSFKDQNNNIVTSATDVGTYTASATVGDKTISKSFQIKGQANSITYVKTTKSGNSYTDTLATTNQYIPLVNNPNGITLLKEGRIYYAKGNIEIGALVFIGNDVKLILGKDTTVTIYAGIYHIGSSLEIYPEEGTDNSVLIVKGNKTLSSLNNYTDFNGQTISDTNATLSGTIGVYGGKLTVEKGNSNLVSDDISLTLGAGMSESGLTGETENSDGSKTYGKAAFASLTSLAVKPTAVVTAAPTAKTGLTASGSAQSLINAGTASGGTMKYAVTTANQEPAAEAYTFDNTSIPAATEAGTYYVWYKAVGDGNHSDSVPAYVTSTIRGEISQTVTFKVVNGSWNDGTTADKTVNLNGYEGDTLKLAATDIPAVGNKPGAVYKVGSWDVTPDTKTAITTATTYTYTYAQKDSNSHTVTFKVVNGSWDDGTTADKTVILNGYEGDTLKLAATDIPAVGNKPGAVYKVGSWDVTPDTKTAITAATTYTYTYVHKESTEGEVTFNKGEGSDETPETVVESVESSDLTEFAETQKEEGKEVKVELEITPKKETDIAQTSVDGTKQIAEGLFVGFDTEKVVTEYFDIDLTKYVDNKDAGNIHDTGSPIEIALKYDKTKMFDPVVVRTHQGKTVEFSKLNARPAKADYKDATYYVGDGVIYIYSRYFSDYAIIYTTVKTYNVDIITNTGSNLSKTVAEGSKVDLPADLSKSGYTFSGWYSDEACTKVWKEDDAVTADITIYAKWTKNPAPTQVPTTVPTSAPTPVPTSAPVTTPTATPTPTVAPTVTPTPVKDSITAEEAARGAIKLNAGLKVYLKNSDVVVKWGKVDNADRYVIYAAYCKKGRKCAKIATLDGDVNSYKFSELNGKAINTKKNIKLYVVAYRKVNGKYKKITSSITAHIVGSGSKKYSNVKGINVESTKITLSLDDNTAAPSSFTLNPVAVLKDSSKKMLLHTAEFRYASSKSSVATVGKDGTIKAHGKGTCYIYVYAQNGYAKKVKVTVK